MEYKVIRHAEGEERENHKYIARVKLKKSTNKKKKNNYRYFYTKAEWQAYLKEKQAEREAANKSKYEQFMTEKTLEKKETSEISVINNDEKPTTVKAPEKKKLSDILAEGKKFVDKVSSKNEKTKVGDAQTFIDKAKKFISTTLKDGIGTAVANIVSNAVWDRSPLKPLEEERAKQEERQKKEVLDEFSDLKVKDEESTDEEDQAETNPYYYTKYYEYTNNCAYCTAAYDLRQRGYDVEAAAIDYTTANYADTIASWYDGAEIETAVDMAYKPGNEAYLEDGVLDYKEATECLEKDLLKHGDGARGHLLLYWNNGGGHDVIWEVEDGEVVIRDCQTNETLEPYDYISLCRDFSYIRTDNLEPNEEILKTVRNKGDR